jgi:hypothetical protein
MSTKKFVIAACVALTIIEQIHTAELKPNQRTGIASTIGTLLVPRKTTFYPFFLEINPLLGRVPYDRRKNRSWGLNVNFRNAEVHYTKYRSWAHDFVHYGKTPGQSFMIHPIENFTVYNLRPLLFSLGSLAAGYYAVTNACQKQKVVEEPAQPAASK